MGRRRILLLQVRDHSGAERQERNCFLRACSLAPEDLLTHNVVAEPEVSWARAREADVLMIGGAGEHSATRDYPFTRPMGELVRRWLDERRPFFGSCFGHHFVARLLGGTVITDRRREEIGSFEVTLSKDGAEDPVFSGLPPAFVAQFGHHDRVSVLPPGSRALAHTSLCPNQALRLGDDLAYTTQFHPEMTIDEIRERLLMYQDGYLDSAEHRAAIDRLLTPSPEAALLLARFLAAID